VQLDPITATLRAPGLERFIIKNMLNRFQFCFNFAFKFNLRRYNQVQLQLMLEGINASYSAAAIKARP